MKNIFNNIIAILTKQERHKFFLLIIFSLLVSIADIASLAFLFFVINFYTPQNAALNIPFLSHLNINEHSLLPAVLLLVVFGAKSFFGYYVFKAQQKFVKNVSSRISDSNLLRYMEGSYTEHVNVDSAVYVQKIYHQPMEFAYYILSNVQQVIAEFILVVLSVIGLLLYSAKLLLIVSLVLLPAVGILSYVTKKRLTGIRKNIQKIQEQTLQYLSEALTGFVESNIYNKNEQFINRYSNVQALLNNYIAEMQITQGLPSRFFEAFAVFGLFILIVAGQYGGSENAADIFKLGAFVAAAYKIIPGISRVINLSGVIKTYSYTLSQLIKDSKFLYNKKYDTKFENIESIEFKNVSFSYNHKPVFHNLNLKINKGSFIGVSGISGRGKTTLINMLMGFLEPTDGNVLFNDKITEPSKRKTLWQRVSYVKQEPFIIHDTILKNIILLEENYDLEKLNKAIEASGLNAVINQSPEELNKVISEDGKNISGGQRQRVAIARALYKDSDIIILDEPFNELDEASEMELIQHFKCLSQKGKTIILITHNSKSLSFCDSVINLDEQ